MTCPLYEGAGAREHYPSTLLLAAARDHERTIETASALRAHGAAEWLRRPASPLAAQLRGRPLDAWEVGMRAAVHRAQTGAPAPSPDPLGRALEMLGARAGAAFSEWDGNLAALATGGRLTVPSPVSPTRLEKYGECGFRFMLSTILGLRGPEQPSDPETIDPLVRGTVVHGALEAFFRERHDEGRPGVGEAWQRPDAVRLLELFEEGLAAARARGLGGLPVFARQQERALRADLIAFLDADSVFRRETGAVPMEFERRIDAVGPGGQRFMGYVDRIDRSHAGQVWVVDYKTGRPAEIDGADPLGGGTRLQLPVYLLAAEGAVEATAVYWYITARGGFQQARYTASAVATEVFARTVAAIGAGVASGAFPPVPGAFDEHWSEFANCGRCDFTRICSRARGDDFARKSDHPGMEPWHGVGAAAAVVARA